LIRLIYKPEDKFILGVMEGDVSHAEMVEYVGNLSAIDAPDGHIRGLMLIRPSFHPSNVSVQTMDICGKLMATTNFRNNSKNAIVASTELGFGLARMYGSLSPMDGIDELRIFKDDKLQEAIDWLDVNDFKATIMQELSGE